MLAGVCERGVAVPGAGVVHFQTYESAVLYPLRFMIDQDVVGGNWVEAPPTKYKLAQTASTYCQIEIDIRCVRGKLIFICLPISSVPSQCQRGLSHACALEYKSQPPLQFQEIPHNRGHLLNM